MANTIFTIILILATISSTVLAADDDLGGSDDANYDENQSIDEVINNAAMAGHLDQLLELAKKPDNIELYMMADDMMQGTVVLEGDMLLTEEQYENMEFVGDTPSRKKRKAIKSQRYRWPNNVVQYSIARGHFSGRDLGIIRGAINEWQRETCLVFQQSSATNRVVFQNGGGCSSYVGRIGRTQPLSLASGCRHHGIVVHEMGHAIGFQHEQTRPDRDRYVTIHKQNISPRALFNFQRYSWNSVVSHGVPYDYLSVMHYGKYAFSHNRQPAITVKDPRFRGKIGNRKGLSFRDIKLANLIYKCAASKNCPRKKCPGEGFVDKHCNCKCPGNPIKSCNAVGTLGPTSRPGRTTSRPIRTVRPTGRCQDKSSYCKMWSVGNGCKHFYGFLSKTCRKTCGFCAVIKKTCLNKNKYCESWKKRGFCNHAKYLRYMKINCAKSCRKCESGQINEGPTGKCEDKKKDCRSRSKLGQCESKPDYMKDNCAETCSYCF